MRNKKNNPNDGEKEEEIEADKKEKKLQMLWI